MSWLKGSMWVTIHSGGPKQELFPPTNYSLFLCSWTKGQGVLLASLKYCHREAGSAAILCQYQFRRSLTIPVRCNPSKRGSPGMRTGTRGPSATPLPALLPCDGLRDNRLVKEHKPPPAFPAPNTPPYRGSEMGS